MAQFGLLLAVQAAIAVGSRVAINLIRGPLQASRIDEVLRPDQGEGSPVLFCRGQTAPTVGRVLWRHRYSETDTKGNIFVGEQEEITYRAHVFVGLADATAGPMDSLVKLWHGGKLIYDADADVAINSTQLSVTKFEEKYVDANGDTQVRKTFMDITSASGGPDLTQLIPGTKTTVAGFTESANNGTFGTKKTFSGPGAGETTVRLRNSSVVTEAAGDPVTLSQDHPEFHTGKVQDVTFYDGSSTQVHTGTVIEDIEGADVVENWRGISGVLLKGLKLNDTGGQISDFRAVVASDSSAVDLADVVEDVCTNYEDIRGAQIDTSGVSGTVPGYATLPTNAREMLEPLMVAYDLMAQERDQKIYFFTRDNAPEVAVTKGDLAAHVAGDDAPRTFTVEDQWDLEIPKKITVQYLDADLDYEQGSQSETALDAENDDEKILDLSLVLTGAEARAVAAKVRWMLEGNRHRVKGQLPPSYIHIQENDVLTWTDDDSYEWNVLLDRVDRQWDGIVAFEGVEENVSALDFPRTADDPEGFTPDLIYTPPDLELVVADIAPLNNDHLETPGIVWGTAAADANATFLEATLYKSADGTTFERVDSTDFEAVVGLATSELGDALPEIWDETNTVDVEIAHGTLENATAAEVLVYRANYALIGDEVIAFRTATATASGYTLSGLLRGLRGSERWVDKHVANERFMLLSGSAIRFHPVTAGEVGSTLYWKAVPTGATVADHDAQSATFNGNTVKPWSPWNVWQDRRDSSVWTAGSFITWTRRTRELTTVLGPKGLIEPFERYRIQILDAPGGNVVRGPKTVSGTSRWFYSDSQQSSDGFSPPVELDVQIEQWSEILQDWGHSYTGKARL